MKNLKIYLIPFTLILVTLGCGYDQSEPEPEIADLLPRHEKLRVNGEWSQIQNTYVSLRDELKSDPQNVKAGIKLAQLYIQEARVTGEHGHYYPAALQVLDQVNGAELTNDQRFAMLSTRAIVLLSLHKFSEALDAGKQALTLNPYNAQIYGVMVDAYVELGYYDQAVVMADRMVSIRPDLRSYARISYLREIHGDIEGAIEAMQMAVEAGFPPYEETAWANLTLGELYERYNRPEKAAGTYHQILQQREDYPFAIAALAQMEAENGNYTEAIAELDRACEIIPEVSFYVAKARIYKVTNQKDQMRQMLDEVFVMLEDDVKSGHMMDLEYAHIYADLLDEPEKALPYLEGEYKKRPDNIDVNKELACLYLQMGDLEKSAWHLEKAQRTKSQDPDLVAVQEQLNLKKQAI